MRIDTIPDNDLIRKLACDGPNAELWAEFMRRYREFIALIARRVSSEYRFEEGMNFPEDVVMSVCYILLKNDRSALKHYKGEHDNTVFEWLKVITINEVHNQIAKTNAKRRIPPRKLNSIDKNLGDSLRPFAISDKLKTGESNVYEVLEEIEYCLEKIHDKSREKHLYGLIVRLWLYSDMTAEDIHKRIKGARSIQRIRNIITESKKKLQACLRNRGIHE